MSEFLYILNSLFNMYFIDEVQLIHRDNHIEKFIDLIRHIVAIYKLTFDNNEKLL